MKASEFDDDITSRMGIRWVSRALLYCAGRLLSHSNPTMRLGI